MPIFGNFTEIPLPDVVSLIAQSSGKLDIWRYSSQHHYELFLSKGVVSLLRFDDQPLENSIQAKSFLKDLVQANEGEFEFIRGEAVDGPHQFRIEELLRTGLAEADEVEVYREHFPDPETVFILTTAPQAWLDEDISEFWNAAKPYFAQGACARELFNNLGLYLDQILLKMYKLRAAGMIEIYRAKVEHQDAEIPSPVFEPTKSPELEAFEASIHHDNDVDEIDFLLDTSDGGDVQRSPKESPPAEAPVFEAESIPDEVLSSATPDKQPKREHGLGSVDLYAANEATMRDLMASVQAAMARR